MKQVIRWLTMGLASQTKAEKRFCEETPLERPTDDAKLRLAIELIKNFDEMPVGDHLVKIDGIGTFAEDRGAR